MPAFFSKLCCLAALSLVAARLNRRPRMIPIGVISSSSWSTISAGPISAFYGSQFHETPNIDALANSSTRFNQGYAACPVCSPTRASILTGRHPVRVDVTDWIPGMTTKRVKNPRFQHVDDRDSLALKEVTIAEVLKENGYATFFAGKWHLGGEGSLPTDQGFDINIGGFHVGSPPGGYYGPWRNPHLKARNKVEYLTERLTSESIRFLEKQNKEKPFLLYLSYYNVHTPIQPYRKRVDHYRLKAEKQFSEASEPISEHRGVSRTRQDNPDYASMVAAVDDSVGQVLAKLDDLKLTDNTVVMFFSRQRRLVHKTSARADIQSAVASGKGLAVRRRHSRTDADSSSWRFASWKSV